MVLVIAMVMPKNINLICIGRLYDHICNLIFIVVFAIKLMHSFPCIQIVSSETLPPLSAILISQTYSFSCGKFVSSRRASDSLLEMLHDR